MNIAIVLWFVFLTVKTMGLFISQLVGHVLWDGYGEGNHHGLDIQLYFEQIPIHLMINLRQGYRITSYWWNYHKCCKIGSASWIVWLETWGVLTLNTGNECCFISNIVLFEALNVRLGKYFCIWEASGSPFNFLSWLCEHCGEKQRENQPDKESRWKCELQMAVFTLAYGGMNSWLGLLFFSH